MEYRRRRRTGAGRARQGYYSSKQYSRRRQGGGDGVFSIILLLILTAGLVYALVATPLGAAILNAILNIGRSTAPSPTPQLVTPSPDSPYSALPVGTPGLDDAKTERLNFPALEMFALQMGVYDSADNAQGLIASLKSLGAAGYCYKTDSGVRILASCYTTEAAANSVQKRLSEQGYECVVYEIKSDMLEASVTAQENELGIVRSAILLSKSIIDDLNDEVLRFDSEERSVEYGIAVANEMLENVRSIRTALTGINEKSGVIDLLSDYYVELTGILTRFISSGTENRVELSGKLKYMQIEVIEKYAGLISALKPAASE